MVESSDEVINVRRINPTERITQIIKAHVPLSELFGYVTSLRTISSGRASASLTFSHYEILPNNIAEEVIKNAKG